MLPLEKTGEKSSRQSTKIKAKKQTVNGKKHALAKTGKKIVQVEVLKLIN